MEQVVNVLHLSRPSAMGAGKFVYDIHKGLLNTKVVNSKLLVYFDKESNSSDIISFKSNLGFQVSSFSKRVIRKLRKFLNALGIISIMNVDAKYSPYGLNQMGQWENGINVLKKTKFKPDIIFIYFVDYFLNVREIKKIYNKSKARIFFVLPDDDLFTGGCHYTWDCLGYIDECGNCPAMFSKIENDDSRRTYDYKSTELKQFPFEVIAPSKGVYEKANKSSLLQGRNIHKILLPINESEYKSLDRLKCRKYFDLPGSKFIIFIGAQRLSDERKGYYYLLNSLEHLIEKYKLKTDDILFLAAGKYEHSDFPFDYKHVGLLDVSKELPIAYNAADLFLNTSIEDAGPMMINQAILSGCPTIAFEIGVAADLIIDGVSGFLSKLKDPKDLADKIYKFYLLSNEEKLNMRKSSRELGLQKTSFNSQNQKYLELILNN